MKPTSQIVFSPAGLDGVHVDGLKLSVHVVLDVPLPAARAGGGGEGVARHVTQRLCQHRRGCGLCGNVEQLRLLLGYCRPSNRNNLSKFGPIELQ